MFTGIMLLFIISLCVSTIHGAGILTPINANHQPLTIDSHHVDVTINNGFAITQVMQTFCNPNQMTVEAVYSFPIPESASLSEVTIYLGETEINGEVLKTAKAKQVYEEEKSKGNDAGLTEKKGFYTFDFSISQIPSMGDVRIRFLYYQPLKIDLGVGRYVYPLEEGGTDEAAQSFWSTNEKVDNLFSINVDLKTAYPVSKVRVPGFDTKAVVAKKDENHYQVRLERQNASLNHDFVFYYKLAENLPGRVELIPYRASKDKPGSFMMVVTPGLDLKLLKNGADYTFVLDTSGSMSYKINTLVNGIKKVLGKMKPYDRFRIISFNTNATDITGGFVSATRENLERYCQTVSGLRAGGSTNIYAALKLATDSLDADRTTSIILVTDGVTNEGIVDHVSFEKLLKKNDVRLFGFLMGNSGNWPLLKTICETTGGYMASISNDDDIIGQIMLAKSKILRECLHNAELSVSGVKVFNTTDSNIGKVYQGDQLVIFGRYENGGTAKVTLKGNLTGKDKEYTTTFDFPEVDTRFPEIERLWAMDRIEYMNRMNKLGKLSGKEVDEAISDLGVNYQLVTDETSMIVLSNDTFKSRGIKRRNKSRIAIERKASSRRNTIAASYNKTSYKVAARKPIAPPVKRTRTYSNPYRVDNSKPMFQNNAPSSRSGGGSFDGFGALGALSMIFIAGIIIKRDGKE